MTCACYPEGMSRGCTGPASCWVTAELKKSSAQVKAEYQAAAAGRARQLGESLSQHEVHDRLQRIGVPGDSLMALRSLRETTALAAAQKWWKADHRIVPALVLAGPAGCGKSTAAAWVAERFATLFRWNAQATGSPRAPLVWLEGGQLAQMAEWTERGAEAMNDARSCRILVINDTGMEATRPALSALANLIMGRVDFNRPVVLSTNLTGEAFVQRYGTALADRLRVKATAPNLAREPSLRSRPSPLRSVA